MYTYFQLYYSTGQEISKGRAQKNEVHVSAAMRVLFHSDLNFAEGLKSDY